MLFIITIHILMNKSDAMYLIRESLLAHYLLHYMNGEVGDNH